MSPPDGGPLLRAIVDQHGTGRN
ncbi:hypothetical protein IL54_2800 [Sphingobium sp. ba1]|nr:hypothetical protein IL54_2800 [Sphingobium sp. ba1]